ncbi:MAG: hypothetical protein [Microvirus sp.]|nr:MAG: hypothetical protein [Microvirus sp.]
MAFRKSMSRGHSKSNFRGKSGHHRKNDLRNVSPMRGGIRL